jgi:ElaB/YqjD/DUF883 family membrane-anchored ribosome-binding protein
MAEESNPVDGERNLDAERIKDEIERTRANMSGTIDEIQDRLNPNNLMQQAKDSVKDATVSKVKDAVNTASGAANRAMGNAQTSANRAVSSARQNPVPAALVASGVVWLVSRSMTSGSRTFRRGDYDKSSVMGSRQAQGAFLMGVLGYVLVTRTNVGQELRERMNAGAGTTGRGASLKSAATDRLRSLAEPAKEAAARLGQRAKETASDYAESSKDLGQRAKETASEYAERGKDLGQRAKETASEYAERGKDLGQRAKQVASQYADRSKDIGQSVSRWIGENPLAVGAAVVALGTVIGLSLSEDDDDDDYDDDDRGYEWSRTRRDDSSGDYGAGSSSDSDRLTNDLGPRPGQSGRTRM